MSITKAMWTGVSGLGAEGGALGVIGDNIANGNTVGFKASRALFEDILGGAIGSNVGGGVRLARTQQIFGQGSIVNTGQATDLAISGDGFFVVKGSLGGVTGDFYSRAGQFTPDNQGFLVNPQGLKLQGFGMNPDGTISANMGDIQLPTTPIPAKATSTFDLQANLDPTSTPPALTWDANNAAATSNFSTPMTVVDSLGASHDVNVYYVKTPTGWDYHVVADGDELSPAQPGVQAEIGAPGGQLTFNTDGGLATQTMTSASFDFAGATPGQVVTLNFGTPGALGAPGTLDGITQTSGANSNNNMQTDGYAAGLLTGVKIDPDGTVMGTYDNGEQMALAQVATAKFASNDGLDRAGGNCWVKTRESGDAAIAAAGTGGRGSLVAGALEQSNVDIAEQFVRMISHQRSFQANSKTITTADEMLQEVVNLKR